MNIAFIGGGNMGEAMIAAILNKKLAAAQSLTVSDISEVRRRHLKQKYGVAVTGDNRLAVSKGQVVVLAIKPQNLAEIMSGLRERLSPSQLVLSIIAGARIDTLRPGLNHNRIIRAMPNTPAQIGEGMTVWTATGEVTNRQRRQASLILGSLGRKIYVDDEKYIDMATAISGSGPAYFFLFVEALTDAGVEVGLPRKVAKELVLQTMLGSGHLIEKSNKTPPELRRMVTSPGGTTAAALQEFETSGFISLVKKAVNAAYNRAKELGNDSVTSGKQEENK
jgi:pyrroline-5-carboxylate reductase